MKGPFSTVAIAVVFRVIIALATQTFFQPDEFFQSLEVAHHLVFGYGHLTWEWLSPKPIRSILYPALNVPIYWLLKVFRLDGTKLLIWGPKILHGALASITDIWLCRLTRKIAGERYVPVAFFLSLTSLFHGLSLSRSMSNSLETSLTTAALSYFPWEMTHASWRKDLLKSLSIAALACAIRPTNALVWVYMILSLLWQLRSSRPSQVLVIRDVCVVGIAALTVLCVVDSFYYGRPTLTPLNFIFTNLSSVSLFYGSSPWHYYLTQAVPILCTTALPFVLHGAWLQLNLTGSPATKKTLGLIAWVVGSYSLAGHKEWRFIHPILPVLHILAAVSLVELHHQTIPKQSTDHNDRITRALHIRKEHALLLLLNLPALSYLMFAHGRAQVDVLYHLRSLNPHEVRSVGFLMPCHSTPWQAYFHAASLADDRLLWALGCEPPLSGETAADYKDQTDIFYESPISYLQDRFPAAVDPSFPRSPLPFSKPGAKSSGFPWKHEWPEYLVVFGALFEDPSVPRLLEGVGYREVWHQERGWEGDDRRRGGVLVLRV